MNGEVRNLRNIVDTTSALPSPLSVSGTSIGGGKMDVKGKLNILKKVPDMDLDMKLTSVHLPALSNYTKAYAAFDIEEGNLNVYSEFILKNGQISGYIKPMATKIAIIDMNKDSNPIQFAWEVVVAAVVEIFTNQTRDQFATKIPLSGNLNSINTDSWSAIAGIVRNAFIEAFKQGIDSDVQFSVP